MIRGIIYIGIAFLFTACCSLYEGQYARQTRQNIGLDTLHIKEKCKEYIGDSIQIDNEWYPVKYY